MTSRPELTAKIIRRLSAMGKLHTVEEIMECKDLIEFILDVLYELGVDVPKKPKVLLKKAPPQINN